MYGTGLAGAEPKGRVATLGVFSGPSARAPNRAPSGFDSPVLYPFSDRLIVFHPKPLGPAPGRLATQDPVTEFEGQGLVNSFVQREKAQGTLTSPEFEIARPYLAFRVGGGARPDVACINLLDNDQVVRTATGRNSNQLEQSSWDVRDLIGRKVRLQIVDKSSAAGGYILADQFVQSVHRTGRLIRAQPRP